jgi:hypothetical protein
MSAGECASSHAIGDAMVAFMLLTFEFANGPIDTWKRSFDAFIFIVSCGRGPVTSGLGSGGDVRTGGNNIKSVHRAHRCEQR